MRTVFVFPADAAALPRLLDDVVGAVRRPPWVVPAADGSPALYLHVAVLEPAEWDTAELDRLAATLGRRPDRGVLIEVSGRVPGAAELGRTVLALLAGGGIAVDEHDPDDRGPHPWTAAEIGNGTEVGGRRFLDPFR